MSPELHLLLDLQALDKRIAELEKEIAALPKHVAEIEKALDARNRRLEADRAALVANQKERKKLDVDVQTHQGKISKLRDQTLQAKTNEQYRAFQHEIEFCEKEIRKCEDRVLDLMGEAEPLEAAVKSAEVALKAEKAQVDAEKKQAQQRTATDQKALAEAIAERKAVGAKVGPALANSYDRIRKKNKNGIAIAEAADGKCGACTIMLRPQFFQDLKQSAVPMNCENCGRMLYIANPLSYDPITGVLIEAKTVDS